MSTDFGADNTQLFANAFATEFESVGEVRAADSLGRVVREIDIMKWCLAGGVVLL